MATGGLIKMLHFREKAAVCALLVAVAQSGCKTKREAALPEIVLVRLSGSNTIGAELAPALAEAWLGVKRATEIARQPGAKPDETRLVAKLDGKPVAIEIKAHGSQTAFSDLTAGACDIGMS